jgi:DNA-binding GntR family transcriptional regulator
VEEHEKIIEAFRSRDASLAEMLVQKNAEYGGRVLIDEDNAPGLSSAPEMDL